MSDVHFNFLVFYLVGVGILVILGIINLTERKQLTSIKYLIQMISLSILSWIGIGIVIYSAILELGKNNDKHNSYSDYSRR